MEINQLRDLSRFMDKNGLVELELEEEDFKIKIKKGPRVHYRGGVYSQGEDLSKPLEGKPEPPPLSDVTTFTSPMVGTFYRRPEEGAKPYVQIGTQIKVGDILCHIQAMGIVNEIRSKMQGRIVEVLIEDGHPVEYGQPLFLIKSREE